MPAARLATLALLREELPLCALVATAVLFQLLHKRWFEALSDVARSVFLFIWLFAAIVWGAKAVVRHADHLAARLGEPYGTLILTLSVASIEMVTTWQPALSAAFTAATTASPSKSGVGLQNRWSTPTPVDGTTASLVMPSG